MGKRYGVSHGQISQDIDAIAKEVKAGLGNDAELFTTALYDKIVKELVKGDNRDKFNAWKVNAEFNSWLFEIGARRKAPVENKVEVVGDPWDFAASIQEKKEKGE